MPEPLLEEQRENWGSRAGFVLAAIGSAVGLGNLWGFPYKVYSHGGGAFLIPYVIAMVLIGIPLLIAEFSLGHLTQRATPDAYGRVNRKFAFVGWWQIILSFIIITYYAVILAWCCSFLYYSVIGIIQGKLPWAGTGLEGVRNASKFFFDDYLSFNEGFSLGRLQWHIIVALAITWAVMYLCICRGVRLVGKVVMWTVPLPWLMLLILTVRGLTLEGAVQGLEYYLEPNWSQLSDPTTWRWAFGQMFFSMSLAFGIMITYSSFLHRKSDLNNNAMIIGLADMGTSFVAGLAVFATLGGMAFASTMAGEAVPVEQVAKSGPSLAFVAFPYALAQLPHAAWFSLLFFGSLLLLGIDSGFSITESVLASIVDKTGWNRGKTLIGLSLVGLLIGVVFCSQGGLSWLGTFDDFINGTWGITLTALMECFVLGWLFRLRRLREHANERSDWKLGVWWDWAIRVVIPIVLAALFAWSLFDSFSNPSGYAYKYESGEVTVEVPPTEPEQLPDRPVLEMQFVASYSGATEHAFTLDEQKPQAAAGWKAGADENTAPLADTFKASDLVSKHLTFTTNALTPQTAYVVQYRWASRPLRDPKTGLPVPVPKTEQPHWTELTQLTTTREKAGVNIANAAGLALMALAPILAIIISALRFNRIDVKIIHTDYSDHKPTGRILGTVALVLGAAGVVGLVLAFVNMIGAAADLRAGADPATVGEICAFEMFLVAGALAGLLALLVGGLSVWQMERRLIKASMLTRLAAALGILTVGLAGGLVLTAWTMATRFQIKPIVYNNELSGASYLILGGMLGLIVIGLLWCFYRAIRATSRPDEAPQLPEGD